MHASPPRVLVVHNRYQIRGGEESVVEMEVALLRQNGHEVTVYERDNHEITRRGKLEVLKDTFWSRTSHRDVLAQVKAQSIDVVHVHNTLPLVSPSVYWAVARTGAALVQTLHNFRWLCPKATLQRAGGICEDCVGRFAWPAITHRCYRGSAVQSAVMATTYSLHTRLGSLHRHADRIIALTDFACDKFIAGGMPADKLVVKPNAVVDMLPPSSTPGARRGVICVGRLSEEKGPDVLVAAAARLPDLSFELMGTGPLDATLPRLPNVGFLGVRPYREVRDRMQTAQVLVLPSRCYEGLPMTLIEAYASGLPVIASRLGALAHLVRDGETGLLFTPGDAADLAEKLRWAHTHPEAMLQMGRAARQTYLNFYTPQANYSQLTRIYQDAMTHRIARAAS